MSTIRISATAARNKFFDLLNQVAQGTQVIIEKDNKEVAILSPKIVKTDWKGLVAASKPIHGILKDVSVEEIAPVNQPDVWKEFGEWDKELQTKTATNK